MQKAKLGLIFGGMSTENEVSVISAQAILENLDREKYEIFPIYIGKDGTWYRYIEKNKGINFGEEITNKEEIQNVIQYLQELDVIFPVLHGLYGEDGTIQGLFELLKKPYVGCKVLASSIGMDKVYTKIIFEKAGLKQANYEYIRKYNENYIYIDKNLDEKILDMEEITKKITNNIKFSMFVKPSNSGSSVGITKVHNKDELKDAIVEASKYDSKILIEEEIKGKEVECAVLGNEEVIASTVGEVKSADEFYSYSAKYENKQSRTIIPAEISEEIVNNIRNQAIKAFKSIDGKGLSRVDFFIQDGTNNIFINEINTMPGFTDISMYPKLFEASGIKYKDLLDKIIDLAINKNP